MSRRQLEDPAMTKIRAIIEKHALSMHDLGVKMGYPEQSARKSVWQLLKSADPRISMLRRFAKAMGINVKELL